MANEEMNFGTWADEPARTIDGAVLFATCGAVALFIVLLTVHGAEYFEANILPWLFDMSAVLALGVAAAGALYLVGKAARPALLLYLSPASILLGFAAWTYAFTLTAKFAGPAWLAAGFSLGGIPLLPIGVIAAILAGALVPAAITATIFLIALAARILGDRCAGVTATARR